MAMQNAIDEPGGTHEAYFLSFLVKGGGKGGWGEDQVEESFVG